MVSSIDTLSWLLHSLLTDLCSLLSKKGTGLLSTKDSHNIKVVRVGGGLCSRVGDVSVQIQSLSDLHSFIGSHAENSARQLQELHCIDRERSNFCVFGRVDTGDGDGLGVFEKRMEQMASLQIKDTST